MNKRRLGLAVVAMCLLGGLVYLTVAVDRFRSGLDNTASLASWAVAAGTLVLASATFQLARRARDEAAAVRDEAEQVSEQIKLQREQYDASFRPCVYPSAPAEWVSGPSPNDASLPLKNGGPGLALNVRGRVVWNLSRGSWMTVYLYASSIAPADSADARLSKPAIKGWVGAMGYVRYADFAGKDWVTYFRFTLGEGNQLVGEHLPPEKVSKARDPDTLDEADVARETERIGRSQ
jgi:hypothetical protein